MRPIKDILKTMEYGPFPEANGDVNLWLEQHGRSFGHYINGTLSNRRPQLRLPIRPMVTSSPKSPAATRMMSIRR